MLVPAPGRAADRKPASTPPVAQPSAPDIDPTTGLPTPAPLPPWIEPNWKQPDKVLPDVSFDGVPLSEVGKFLRKEFNGAFDVLFPNGWQHPSDAATMLNPQADVIVKLQLKNVTASEIFNAMNMEFMAENSPVRWELRMNGNRPTAVLRVMPELMPPVPARQPLPPTRRMVYFVGDLVDETRGGEWTMEQLVKTVSEIYQMSYGESPKNLSNHLQFHKEAQLLVVTGTSDQIEFIQQTLNALRQKGRPSLRSRRAPAELPPEEKKTQ